MTKVKMSPDDMEVASQTQAEVRIGRMVPYKSHRPKGKRAPFRIRAVTKRFAVRQTDSKGKSKVRCIDDFTRSGVNKTCTVRRRIKMGSIKQLGATMRILRKKFP